MSFTFPYETIVAAVELSPGLTLRLEKLKSLDETIDGFFALYEKTGREELFEDLCPYFGVPWPAGTALAKRVAQEASRWQDAKVLELACGLALPSLALAKLGVGEVTASDLHPDVPEFLRRNSRHNEIEVAFRPLDWRKATARTDLLLASDLVYDRRQPETLRDFLLRSEWREVILADPGRPYWPSFLELLRGAGLVVSESREGPIQFARVLRP